MKKILKNSEGQIRTSVLIFLLWAFCSAVAVGAFWLDRNY